MNCRRKTVLGADCSGNVVRLIRAIVSAWLCAAMGVTVSQAAQVDYFLKLDGIDGEATSAFHQDWIVVHSAHLGAVRSPGDPAPPGSRFSRWKCLSAKPRPG